MGFHGRKELLRASQSSDRQKKEYPTGFDEHLQHPRSVCEYVPFFHDFEGCFHLLKAAHQLIPKSFSFPQANL
jgi:hypothetical protein